MERKYRIYECIHFCWTSWQHYGMKMPEGGCKLPYADAGKADTQEIVELAKKYLKKWCGRKKIRGITIFEPQVAAEVEGSEDADEQ